MGNNHDDPFKSFREMYASSMSSGISQIMKSLQDNYPFEDLNRHLQETMSSIFNLSNFVENITKPLISAVANVTEQFKGISFDIIKSVRPWVAIEKLGNAQYVYWDYLIPDFVDTIIESENINKTLREINLKDKYQHVKRTISQCENHTLLQPYSRLYSQTIDAYRKKHYDLASYGLLSIIDGILSDISGDNSTNIASRAKIIISKIKEDEELDNEEISFLSLFWTFEETHKLLCKPIAFSEKEPKNINRHWIMHGRSHRRRTQLDCIKLINFIYGLILINDFI